MQKTKEKYSKEKAAEYYKQNKGAIKKSQKSVIKTCHKKKKTRLKSIKKDIYIYQKLVQYKKNNFLFFY